MSPCTTVGVLSPLLGGFYFGGLLTGIRRVAQQHGVQVIAVQTLDPWLLHSEHAQPRLSHPVAARHVDGWIVILRAAEQDVLQTIRRSGKPLVTLSSTLPELECPAVLPDNRGGTAEAVRHLLDHGHQRIAFVGALGQNDIEERFKGYQDALLERGITPDPELFFAAKDNLQFGAHRAARRMIDVGMPCSAVVAATDLNAMGVLEVVQEAGYHVPEDLAIIGFDDIMMAQYTSPPLTSVRQRFDALGSAAAQTLLAQIGGAEVAPVPIYVATSLSLRQSCGCNISDSVALTRLDQQAPDWRLALGEKLALQALQPVVPKAQPPDQIWPGAMALVNAVAAAVAGEEGPLIGEIREAWNQGLELTSDPETLYAMVRLLRRVAAEHLDPEDRAGAVRLETVVDQINLELFRARLAAKTTMLNYLDAMIQCNYEINYRLLGSESEGINDLNWLMFSHSRLGYLGLWAAPQPDEHTRMLGTGAFSRDGHGTMPIGVEMAPEEFPPPGLLAAAKALEPEAIVSLLPLRTRTRDWGFLALVAPIETKLSSGRENMAQWAALLSIALEREALLRSLEERQEALRESEERYALAARGANDGLWDWNLRTNQVYYSPRWKAMLGYDEQEIGTTPDEWTMRIHLEDRKSVEQALEQHLNRQTPHFEHEHRMLKKDGSYCWVLCRGMAVWDSEGRPTRMAGSQTDMTTRKEAEAQLLHDALHDALTGMPNRTMLMNRLEIVIGHAKRHADYTFAVLFLDLDRFKIINDSLGHGIGDQLLITTSRRLESCLRRGDMVARLGGDEFAVLLDDIKSISEATFIADRIHKELMAPFKLGGHDVFTTASIGIAISTAGYQRPDEILRDADMAMYRAKTSGKARYEVFDKDMLTSAVTRLQLETDMRRALEQQELRLFYVPVISLATGRVVGVEALVRWLHPERGLITPTEFLPIAEETGMIVQLGAWVLRAAFEEVGRWRAAEPDEAPLSLSINLSRKQFWQPDLVEQIGAILEETGFAPSCLRLEVTENVVMVDSDSAIAKINQLRSQGIQLHMDDFGTGYSSLNALHRFPIDALKIDRGFIGRLGHHHQSTEIVRTIMMMAQYLKMDVIAEGIEAEEQLAALRTLGCGYGQGYLFSPPLDAEGVRSLIAEGCVW